MARSKGFSLIEVLIAFLLLSTISLGFLKKQIELKRLVNQTKLKSEALTFLTNSAARLQAGLSLEKPKKPFSLEMVKHRQHTILTLCWASNTPSRRNCLTQGVVSYE